MEIHGGFEAGRWQLHKWNFTTLISGSVTTSENWRLLAKQRKRNLLNFGIKVLRLQKRLNRDCETRLSPQSSGNNVLPPFPQTGNWGVTGSVPAQNLST